MFPGVRTRNAGPRENGYRSQKTREGMVCALWIWGVAAVQICIELRLVPDLSPLLVGNLRSPSGYQRWASAAGVVRGAEVIRQLEGEQQTASIVPPPIRGIVCDGPGRDVRGGNLGT